MPPGGWFPEQRLSREEALASWTTWAAYAAFEEKTKGVLAPGMLADFIFLSADIMKIQDSEVWKIRVTKTILDGKIVFSE